MTGDATSIGPTPVPLSSGSTAAPLAPATPVSDEYLGCYVDSKDARILELLTATLNEMGAAVSSLVPASIVVLVASPHVDARHPCVCPP